MNTLCFLSLCFLSSRQGRAAPSSPGSAAKPESDVLWAPEREEEDGEGCGQEVHEAPLWSVDQAAGK